MKRHHQATYNTHDHTHHTKCAGWSAEEPLIPARKCIAACTRPWQHKDDFGLRALGTSPHTHTTPPQQHSLTLAWHCAMKRRMLRTSLLMYSSLYTPLSTRSRSAPPSHSSMTMCTLTSSSNTSCRCTAFSDTPSCCITSTSARSFSRYLQQNAARARDKHAHHHTGRHRHRHTDTTHSHTCTQALVWTCNMGLAAADSPSWAYDVALLLLRHSSVALQLRACA